MQNTSLSRRGLIGSVALAGIAACTDETPTTSPAQSDGSWEGIRAQFVLRKDRAHLSTYVFASPPAPVRAAIERHRQGLDADPIGYVHEHEALAEQKIHDAAAEYLGCSPHEISFTDSTTMGLGLLYAGLKLKPGEEILTTEHDFYSTHESLRLRSERDGIKVNKISLYADPAAATVDEIVTNVLKGLTPATKVVAITWVHSATGVKLPVRAIADAIKGKALLCLDSVHGFGAEDAGPRELGCDFLISGCHKWLMGPRGTGLIWGSRDAWEHVGAVIPTFERQNLGVWLGFGNVRTGAQATPGGYHAFEHQWALAEAFGFHRGIGRKRVAERTRELNNRLKEGLAGIKGVKLITPRAAELSAGIVCCDVSGKTPQEIVARLDSAGVVASVTPYRVPYVRFGATIANSESDVDKAIAAVRSLAS